MNEEDKFTGGEAVIIGNDMLWKSFVLDKNKFDLDSLKNMRFAISNNNNKTIFYFVKHWDTLEQLDSSITKKSQHNSLPRRPAERVNGHSSRRWKATSLPFTTALPSTSPTKLHYKHGIKAKFQNFAKFGSKKKYTLEKN